MFRACPLLFSFLSSLSFGSICMFHACFDVPFPSAFNIFSYFNYQNETYSLKFYGCIPNTDISFVRLLLYRFYGYALDVFFLGWFVCFFLFSSLFLLALGAFLCMLPVYSFFYQYTAFRSKKKKKSMLSMHHAVGGLPKLNLLFMAVMICYLNPLK